MCVITIELHSVFSIIHFDSTHLPLTVSHSLFIFFIYFLKEICARQCQDDTTKHNPERESYADHCDESESLLETAAEELVSVLNSCSKEQGLKTCDNGTQNPPLPLVPYKDMAERKQRLIRADITELIRDSAMKMVHFVPGDLTLFMEELLQNKKFCSTFGLSSGNKDITCNPTIQALVKEYQSSVDKEKKQEVRRRASNQKSKVCIGNSLKNSRVTLTGEKTPEHFKDRITAASSLGRLTCYADERRRLLSIVAFDYPYSVLQKLFDCSSKTVAAAKVHCILFGRGGTPPAQFKLKGNVSVLTCSWNFLSSSSETVFQDLHLAEVWL